MLKSYPKILPAVGKYGDYVLHDRVEITEKIDGSAFAFGKDHDGKLHMRSKGCVIDPDDKVQKMFQPAVTHVLTIQDRIPNGIAYYCETLETPRHNTLAYSRVPVNHLMLYGVTDFARTVGNDYELMAAQAEYLDIEPVPLIEHATLDNLTQLADYIDRESALGGAKIEGIVVKNYRTAIEFSGQIYPFAAVKFVSEQFKEKHKLNPEYTPRKDKLQCLLDAYRTEARWQKAVQHLAESGLLVSEPKDIGKLMQELARDLTEEEAQNFKDELFAIFRKDWVATASRGFPEWYKQRLLGEAA